MTVKVRNLKVDARTAELLEARAAARGLSVSELLADLAAADEALPPALEAMRNAGTGPWAPDVLADDARRLDAFRRTREGVPWDEVETWMKSWGTPRERPVPGARKL
jgi:hypothetical protein